MCAYHIGEDLQRVQIHQVVKGTTTMRSNVLVKSAILLSSGSALMQAQQAASQVPQGTDAKIAALEAAVKSAQMAGDNAWMLVSAALVLMMTGPGLALFYGGLGRRENTLAIMMQSFALRALITVMWAVGGYSLCFGGGWHFPASVRRPVPRAAWAGP